MAKKKGAEKGTEARETDAGSEQVEATEIVANSAEGASETAADEIVEAATPAFVADEALFLVAEVQSFLNKRSELAEKLAREIEATERRLVELKRTAALLSSTTAPAPVEPSKVDKKPKKPTLKKPEKKPEAPRRLLDHAEQAGDAEAHDPGGDPVETAKSPADEELVAQS